MALKIRERFLREPDSPEAIRRRIEKLSDRNRRRAGAAREEELVELRHRLATLADHPGPEPTAPVLRSEVDCPVPPAEADGLPEAPAAGLEAETVRAAMLSHGALVVRGAADDGRAAQLREGIDRAMADRDSFIGAPAAERSRTPWFAPFNPETDLSGKAGWNRIKAGSGAVWASDSPRVFFEVTETLREAGLLRIAADYLGEPPTFAMSKAVLRRSPADSGGAWHQDGAFLGDGIRTLNIWMALSDCGERAPGMEVVPRRLEQIVEPGTEGAIFDWSVADAEVERVLGGAPTSSPVFAAGDVLLFDHMNLHRTGVKPGMTETRYATETWCFAPSALPDHLAPLAI